MTKKSYQKQQLDNLKFDVDEILKNNMPQITNSTNEFATKNNNTSNTQSTQTKSLDLKNKLTSNPQTFYNPDKNTDQEESKGLEFFEGQVGVLSQKYNQKPSDNFDNSFSYNSLSKTHKNKSDSYTTSSIPNNIVITTSIVFLGIFATKLLIDRLSR